MRSALSKEDIDWNLVGGLSGKATLKQNIEAISSIMISVATETEICPPFSFLRLM